MKDKTIRKKFRCKYCDSPKIIEKYDGPVKATSVYNNGYLIEEHMLWPKTSKHSKYYCMKCKKRLDPIWLWTS